MSAVRGLPSIFPADSFALAGPGLDVEDDTRGRIVVGGIRKELDLGERCETESDCHERCRRCDAGEVFHGYLVLMAELRTGEADRSAESPSTARRATTRQSRTRPSDRACRSGLDCEERAEPDSSTINGF